MNSTTDRGIPPSKHSPPAPSLPMRRLFRRTTSRLSKAQRLNLAVVLGIPVLVAVGGLVQGYSLGAALPLVAVASIALGMVLYLLGRRSLRIVAALPVAGILLLLFTRFASNLLRSRFVTTAVLSVLTVLLFRWLARRPLAFYRAWLASDVRQRLGDRSERAASPGEPRLWPQVVVLIVAIFVPLAHSTTLAVVTVPVLCVGLLAVFASRGNGPPLRNLLAAYSTLKHVRELYLSYPDEGAQGPGVQSVPTDPLSKRQIVYYALTIPLVLTITVSLSFCCPWELFAHHFNPGFRWDLASRQAFQSFDWITSPFSQAIGAQTAYLWCFVVALPLLIVLPNLVLLVAYLPAFILPAPPPEPVPAPAEKKDRHDEFNEYVERLAHSHVVLETDRTGFPRKTESEHVFLGVFPETNHLALLDRAILHEHVYIVGQTGSGKTTLGVIPLLIQLIRGYESPERGDDGSFQGTWKKAPPAPILILDLKGDLTLFNTARLEAGDRFLFFSADGRKATHCFDPFTNIQAETRSPIEVCELLIQALNLFHGEYYGASYYSRQHRDLLLTVLDEARRKQPPQPVTSWQELYTLIDERYKGRRHRDAAELLTVIHALTFYDQLSIAKQPPGAPVIHMPTVLAEGQVVYFWLPSLLVNMSVREIAKLALYSFLTTAADYHDSLEEGQEPRQSYVIIDEFQRIAAENVKVIMQQVRNAHVALILANQDPTDLKLPTVDIRSTVKTNTRMRQYFTLTDPSEIDELMKLSGEETQYLRAETFSVSQTEGRSYSSVPTTSRSSATGEARSERYSEIIRPRLSINEIINITNAPQESLLHVIRDSGHTQLHGLPTRIRTPWAMSYDEYLERRAKRWPVREEVKGVIVPERTPDDNERRAKLKAQIRPQLEDLLANVKKQHEAADSEPAPEGQTPPSPPRRKKRGRRRKGDAEGEGSSTPPGSS